MLGHPFIQALICHKYNFYDEEIVDQLINFLRSLALKIDATTVQFFANKRHTNFPLLAVVQKFYNHQESLVRNVARQILLILFQLNDPLINQFLQDLPYASLFCHLGCLLRDTIIELDSTHNT